MGQVVYLPKIDAKNKVLIGSTTTSQIPWLTIDLSPLGASKICPITPELIRRFCEKKDTNYASTKDYPVFVVR